MSSIDREDTIEILKDLQKDHLQFCLIPFRQAIERVQAIPSADTDISEYSDKLWKNAYERGKADRPQGDTVSRRYLLAEIDDLADEFSEVDENGLHSERWCGIVDAKLIIMNAPSVSDRPQGEWVKRTRDMLIAQVNFAYCSECGQPIMHEHTRPLWSFCPNCGARMFAKDTNVPNKKGADDE